MNDSNMLIHLNICFPFKDCIGMISRCGRGAILLEVVCLSLWDVLQNFKILLLLRFSLFLSVHFCYRRLRNQMELNCMFLSCWLPLIVSECYIQADEWEKASIVLFIHALPLVTSKSKYTPRHESRMCAMAIAYHFLKELLSCFT